jgi:hypothetical protein
MWSSDVFFTPSRQYWNRNEEYPVLRNWKQQWVGKALGYSVKPRNLPPQNYCLWEPPTWVTIGRCPLLCNGLLIRLRDYIIEFCFLVANASLDISADKRRGHQIWRCRCQSQSHITTDSLCVRHPSGTRDQFFFLLEIFFRQLRVCYFVVPSLTRGRVCNFLLLLGLARAVPLGSALSDEMSGRCQNPERQPH